MVRYIVCEVKKLRTAVNYFAQRRMYFAQIDSPAAFLTVSELQNMSFCHWRKFTNKLFLCDLILFQEK